MFCIIMTSLRWEVVVAAQKNNRKSRDERGGSNCHAVILAHYNPNLSIYLPVTPCVQNRQPFRYIN